MAEPRAPGRLGRLLRGLEAVPALDDIRLARATGHATQLWGTLFAVETGAPCGPGLPEGAMALAVFRPCPDPRRDPVAARSWHRAQAGLFLHYAPVACRLLAAGSQPGERCAALLLADAMRLLRDHAATLGQDPDRYASLMAAAPPFARLIHRAPRLRSHCSADVNLGAVALALGLESGFRAALGVEPGARLSMWRLFRALDGLAGLVRLGVALPTLVAVYNWASRHGRAGQRGFGWLNYFAADLLHPIFAPEAPRAFGLEAAPEVLARLRVAAEID